MEETVIGRSGVPVFAVLVGVSSFEADWGVCADVEDKMLRRQGVRAVPDRRDQGGEEDPEAQISAQGLRWVGAGGARHRGPAGAEDRRGEDNGYVQH